MAGARVKAWTICIGRRDAAHWIHLIQSDSKPLTEGLYLPTAPCDRGVWPHLLVEEDPEEIRWRGEELFPHAELASGEADARVDGSRRAARGRDLIQKKKKR